MVDNVPILIDDQKSLFSANDILERMAKGAPTGSWVRTAMRILPQLDSNLKAARNYDLFRQRVLDVCARPVILVVGGRIAGRGIDRLITDPALTLVETDIALGPRTNLVCDAHNLPFQDGSIDGVIIQAVLEHVVDPFLCVEEIHRVLAADGVVYAETPFMQQVHGGQYDFTRFTFLGHRRLFKKFEQYEAGATGGPGSVLAWSYLYLLLSLVKKRRARMVVHGFARLTGFWMKYLDYPLIDRSQTLDAASGYFFLGRKSQSVISDRDLLKLYPNS